MRHKGGERHEVSILQLRGEQGHRLAPDRRGQQHSSAAGVHGLRAAIHELLRKDKRVKEYRLGVYGEGEGGVTIVKFK